MSTKQFIKKDKKGRKETWEWDETPEVKAALDKQGVDTFGGWAEEIDGSQRISQEMFVHPLIKAV